MSNTLDHACSSPVENLPCIFLDRGHWKVIFLAFHVFENILQTHITELKHGVLYNPLLVINRVEEV